MVTIIVTIMVTSIVVGVDVIAPSNVDDIRQAGPGQVAFSWLMQSPPETREAAREIRERAMRIPMLQDTMAAGDGKAIALYLPMTHKDFSWNVRQSVLDFTADWPETDQVHITGLPVAEDTFGVEMFYQMAISAPLAMLVIFILMWWFFRNIVLVISPMIVALVTSLSTMALLVATGNTIHIMSSMIPIFIMPIAVLDSVHILSEAFDCYARYRDRRKTMQVVMRQLFRPMLFTSLTTTAGFRLAGPDADSAGAGLRRVRRDRRHAGLVVEHPVHTGVFHDDSGKTPGTLRPCRG